MLRRPKMLAKPRTRGNARATRGSHPPRTGVRHLPPDDPPLPGVGEGQEQGPGAPSTGSWSLGFDPDPTLSCS